ncbi:hypothetical protein RR46_05022 [Papilio xuthus]|uniref:Uncharacterized protein n=1 Tax=Papilio xuthus TaxID=66420 RepID=A0A194PUA1_PAPXU|nr:hypothetical protein RR46_05022 [Papilio xuthus]
MMDMTEPEPEPEPEPCQRRNQRLKSLETTPEKKELVRKQTLRLYNFSASIRGVYKNFLNKNT